MRTSHIKRPMVNGLSYVTTPETAEMMSLLGSHLSHESVSITRDEYRALCRLYGVVSEQPRQKPEAPVKPEREDFPPGWDGSRAFDDAVRKYERAFDAWKMWEDPSPFHQAGADRNLMRHAAMDGLRLAVWLAKYMQPGQDPLREVVRLAMEAGWDVGPADVDWAQGEDDLMVDAAE